MRLTLIFPCDYFDKRVDEPYRNEYEIAKSMGFDCALIDQKYLDENKVKIYSGNIPDGTMFLFRSWMFNLAQYNAVWDFVMNSKDYGSLLVSPRQYKDLHYFSESYKYVQRNFYTPKTVIVPNMSYITESFLKSSFSDYFIMKDDVKSVKDDDFPKKINCDILYCDLQNLAHKFRTLRGNLFTGQYVLKQYMPLKMYDGFTNEWRVYYFLNEILTAERNSNQSNHATLFPVRYAVKLANLPSPFYTIDFAEMENGDWMVVETGDGQVSGLSPNQNVLEFYTKLQRGCNNE